MKFSKCRPLWERERKSTQRGEKWARKAERKKITGLDPERGGKIRKTTRLRKRRMFGPERRRGNKNCSSQKSEEKGKET